MSDTKCLVSFLFLLDHCSCKVMGHFPVVFGKGALMPGELLGTVEMIWVFLGSNLWFSFALTSGSGPLDPGSITGR